jgi:hypothetical protein
MQILTRLCCAAIVGSLTFTGLASAKEKKPYKVKSKPLSEIG